MHTEPKDKVKSGGKTLHGLKLHHILMIQYFLETQFTNNKATNSSPDLVVCTAMAQYWLSIALSDQPYTPSTH